MEMRQPRRITRQLSPADEHRLKDNRQQIADELPDLITRDQMRDDASEEATLSGDLRRAVHASDVSLSRIAAEAGIPNLLLDEFLTGERTLRSDVMDRLATVLDYELEPQPPAAGETESSSEAR
jgi:hypothetical protein